MLTFYFKPPFHYVVFPNESSLKYVSLFGTQVIFFCKYAKYFLERKIQQQFRYRLPLKAKNKH